VDFTHNLVTDKIKNDIRKSVKAKSLTPGYVLIEHENDPPTLSKYMTKKQLSKAYGTKPEKRSVRFPAFKVKDDQVEEHLAWMSGFVLGALTEK
jgi:hypothetical protein